MKKLESGRSMVEMLGVLAIIGVLSIGGIAGYTMAMNRYRANEVLAAAAQIAVIAQTSNQGQGGVVVDLDDIGMGTTKPAGLASDGTIAAKYDSSTNTTTVAITGLSSKDVGTALNSITGGTACGTDTDCGLTQSSGGALKTSTYSAVE